jgi:hypothetical protein
MGYRIEDLTSRPRTPDGTTTTEPEAPDGEEGPLFLALLMGNNNNKNNIANATAQPAPDTLDSRFAVLELTEYPEIKKKASIRCTIYLLLLLT